MTAYDLTVRLKGSGLEGLVFLGWAAGWHLDEVADPAVFGLLDVSESEWDVIDLCLAHPDGGVKFLVRFRAARVGGHPGVYKFGAVRCSVPGVLSHGGSMRQVRQYMIANPARRGVPGG